MNALICCLSCSTEVNDAPVSDWPCKMENQASTAAFLVCGPDLASGDLKGCKRGCGAMPLVIVALPGQGASVRQFQITPRPFKCLDRRFLIDAQDNSVLRRRQIEADHIGGLCRKIWVVAFAPAFASGQIDLLLAQRPPDILHIDVAQSPRDQWPVPASKTLGRRLVENIANALVGHLVVDRRGAGPQSVLQPIKALPRVADTPQADRGRRCLQSRAISRVACPSAASNTIRMRNSCRCSVLPARNRASRSAISRPQPDFHGISYHATLNHAATPHDSANMTQSLRIVGTSYRSFGQNEQSDQELCGDASAKNSRCIPVAFGCLDRAPQCRAPRKQRRSRLRRPV